MVRDTVKVISSTEFQRNIGAKVHEVSTNKHIIIVQAHGRDQVALLPVDRLRELQAKERAADTAQVARMVRDIPDQEVNIENS